MKIKISALLFIFSFLSALPALAQADWQADIASFDPHRWNSETMVNASIMEGGETASHYTLAAYIDGELRGYADLPVALPTGGSLYTLRVKGDEPDSGKAIELIVIDKADETVYCGDEVAVTPALSWTGETVGLPSAPVIIRIGHADIPVESIAAAEGVEIWRGDYDKHAPLILNSLYTVLPADATDKTVTIALADEHAAMGALAYNKYIDRWEFTPAANCKGAVTFAITSCSNPEVSAELTITVKARAESVLILQSTLNMAVGESLDISGYYTVLPEDADNREAIVVSLNPEIAAVETLADGAVTLTALAQGYAEIRVSAAEAPDIAHGLISVNVGIPLAGVSVEILPCCDDILDGETGEIAELRQAIFTPRSIIVTPYPEGASIDPALVSCCISLDTPIPSAWSAGEAVVESADAAGAKITFTPEAPGEYTVTITYDGEETLFTFPVVLKTTILPGWNWFSSPVAHDGALLSEALDAPESLVEARTQRHFLINDPELGYYAGFKDSYGAYINDFTLDAAIDHGHFRIKMADEAEACDLYYGGDYGFDKSVWTLNDGWTWVGTPVPYDFDIAVLNNPVYDFSEGDVIKSDLGFSTFVSGAWTGLLDRIEAGRGYSVMTDRARKVTFKCGDFDQTPPAVKNEKRKTKNHPDTMALIALIEGADAESVVEVYAGGELRGEGRCIEGRWFITASGDPGDFFTILVTAPDGVERTALLNPDNLNNLITQQLNNSSSSIPFSQMAGSYAKPIALTFDNDAIRVSGSTILGSVIAIHDPSGRDLTAFNGHLLPGIYIVSTPTKAVKVSVK